MFLLSKKPLETLNFRQAMAQASAGAYATFEGWVRDHNNGQKVLQLTYEAFESLAIKEGGRILEEARSRFDIVDVRCVHRIGTLQIGEMGVWVGVTASHRKAAFEACQYVIDEIKHRLPIWKKETYADGASGWVNCQHGHQQAAAVSEQEYYQRQKQLPEVGPEGQQLLKRSKVLIVGAGGLGNVVLQYLAMSGVGFLGICDDDSVSASNLHRQILFTRQDVGENKVKAAQRRLQAINPWLSVTGHQGVTRDNVESILQPYDWVVDCTDNFETRFLLSDAAIQLQKPLIQASIYQHEGQVKVYLPGEASACLRCLWSEPSAPKAWPLCGEHGVMATTAGALGMLQALEVLKQLLKMPGRLSGRELLTVDLLALSMHRLKIPVQPECPACNGMKVQNEKKGTPDWIIDLNNFSPEDLARFRLLHLREPGDGSPDLPFRLKALTIPDGPFDVEKLPKLDRQENYLLFCSHGGRSLYLAAKLRKAGYKNIYSLAGGMPALQAFIKKQRAPC
jgi:molybdopterin/thiamine biosynthesis adenylyltransferase/molybdopterin synthase catalytic subunit/rhodanese-related sulfurtransferase